MTPRSADWKNVELRIRKHKFAPTGVQCIKVDYGTGIIRESTEEEQKQDEFNDSGGIDTDII